jgi:low affinity Fe/Cu permease
MPSGNTCPPANSIRSDLFCRMAAWTIRATGGRWGFLSALAVVIIWAASGPFFHYSDNWQLVINTGTTIVTFLMVFLIQNAQNRESKAVHLKLDEIIRALANARNEMIDIENATEEHLDVLAERYSRLANSHQESINRNGGKEGREATGNGASKN